MKSKDKVVWLINEYGTIPENGYGGRVFYLAKNLSKAGYIVYYVVSRNHHLLNSGLSNPKHKIIDGVNVVSISSIDYSKSRSVKRIMNWFIFNFQLLFINFIIKNKPHFIFASSPSPFVGIPLVILSKAYSAKSCFDIRDVWPATLEALGNIKESSIAFKVMSWAEHFSIKNAEIISSNLPNLPIRINEVLGKKKKFILLPNGYDETEMLDSQPLSIDFKNNIPKDSLIVGYAGSVGIANALEYFVEAAFKLKTSKVFFIIVGEGEKLNDLKALVKHNELKNILFLPKVPKNQISSVLEIFDICYIGWQNSKLYEYGVAPNKIPEYFISGKPVLHSYSGPGDPVNLAGAGITVPAEDPIAIADAIELFAATSTTELANMGKKGRQFAVNNYCYKSITESLLKEISH